MNVDAILKAKGERVVTVPPNAPVSTVVKRLKLERIGAVVVSDDGEPALGLLTDRDIALGLADHGAELLRKQAAEIMLRAVRTCTPSDRLVDLMAAMTRHRVRHLPVLRQGKLCGIVSIGDIVKYRLEELELEAGVLRDIYTASH